MKKLLKCFRVLSYAAVAKPETYNTNMPVSPCSVGANALKEIISQSD